MLHFLLNFHLRSSRGLGGIHIGGALNAGPLLLLLLLLFGSRSRCNLVELHIVTFSEVCTVRVRENREHFLTGEPTRVCKRGINSCRYKGNREAVPASSASKSIRIGSEELARA